ncbi:DegT/DnrJ/EryC1/StrS aminotransferase family protein [Candidatus Microgenomates bacterium]|nr:DegT/DnrJ/EryC1/StrS aminotransferase family protein [Candidatus Microgenomates bacterium]
MNVFSSFGANYSFKFVLRVIFARNGYFFQKKLVNFLKKKYQGKVILTYKCREAIELGLLSLALPKESFVAICSISCQEVIGAIKQAGLNIEYLDIGKEGLNFSASVLKRALAKNLKIKAVLIQNTLGYPCEIENIAKICRKNSLVLIEDLAHCVGCKYENGIEAGSMGDMVVLSFSQNKILDVTAGGALIFKKPFRVILPKKEPDLKRQLVDRINPVCMYLSKSFYPLYLLFQKLVFFSKPFTKIGDGIHQLPGWYCSLVLYKLNNLDYELSHRREIAGIYAKLIDKDILSAKLVSQISLSANFRFPVFVPKKEELISYLALYGIFLDDTWFKGTALTLPTHINISAKKSKEISFLINKWIDNVSDLRS